MIPGTIVRLLTGVPLAKDYLNTMTFSNTLTQQAYFIGKQKGELAFSDFSYQRKEGEMRVPVNAEHLTDINYLMFQNANYSQKWFYCFVDSVEYKGENASLVRFTVDCWQTYLFDLVWKNSMIEREHVTDDTVGKNRVPEELEVGTPMTLDYDESTIPALEPLVAIVAATKTPAGASVGGEVLKGVYSGCAYYWFNNFGLMKGFLDSYVTTPDSIKAVFMIPSALVAGGYSNGDIIFDEPLGSYLSHAIAAKTSGAMHGYTPKNNKCYQYPYNYLEVSNQQGAVNRYAWEDFTGAIGAGFANFKIYGNVAPSPTVYLIPSGYKKSFEDSTEMMTLGGYPLCTWSYDAYASWLATSSVSNALSIGSSALSIASGIATKSPMAVASGVMSAASVMGTFYERSLMANPLQGSASGGGNVAAGVQNFRFARKAIIAERMKIIDDFFSMYGYKTLRVGTPNISTRPYWNFLKLNEPNIFGGLPLEELDRIRSSLKTGITFWHDSDVGNYNRNNKY